MSDSPGLLARGLLFALEGTSRIADRLDRATEGVRCADCGHPRHMHKHHRSGTECSGLYPKPCHAQCPRFRWPKVRSWL